MKKIACGFSSALACVYLFCPQVFADRQNDVEFTIQVPYLFGEEIEFEGGARADTNDDPGFGFGVGYNFSEFFAVRGNVNWNDVGYDAVRVLDDVIDTEQSIRGTVDTFSLGFQGDFYLTRGKVAPFLSGTVGWTCVDSNIADGPPSTVCWWDPWYGYICGSAQDTYSKDFWFYGAGVGLRIDLKGQTFLRMSYQVKWLDVDKATETPDFSLALFEFGFSY